MPACLAAAMVLQAALTPQKPQQRFSERVDVGRVLVDARVLDDRGNPVLGLTPDDFRVEIDGQSVRVESATWIGEGEHPPDTAAPPGGASSDPAANHHRLIVFLFQKDLEPSRIIGLMRMLLKSRDLLEGLTPGDRVAVLSFDTRLLVWTDFTGDRERLQRLLSHDVLLGRPPDDPQRASAPSLLAHLEAEEARTTYAIEGALEMIGRALEPLPGAKTLVLIGHGFGRLGPLGMTMEADYGAAARVLVESRTSVFSLDVTEADAHSLEAGLQVVSSDTGGFYARTHIFPDSALRRMAGALAGYYVLLVERVEPVEDSRALHDIEITLTRRKGRVLAAPRYAERWR